MTQDVFHSRFFYLGNIVQITSSFYLSKHLEVPCRCTQMVTPHAKYQQTTCTAPTIQPQTKFSFIGALSIAIAMVCWRAPETTSLSLRDHIVHPKCRRLVHTSEPPMTSRRSQRFSTIPKKRQEWRDDIANLHDLGSISFFPKQFRSSSCNTSVQVQTTSERIIRHLVLAKEQGGGAPLSICSPQAAPAAIVSPSARQFRAAQ